MTIMDIFGIITRVNLSTIQVVFVLLEDIVSGINTHQSCAKSADVILTLCARWGVLSWSALFSNVPFIG